MTSEEHRISGPAAIPRYLYKYRSLSESSKAFARDLIVNQNLYFPAPADLNDPFECKPNLATSATREQQKRYIAKLVARMSPEKPRAERQQIARSLVSDRELFRETMFRATQESLANAGIYSLSARPLDLLMWPHYADNHRGICVRFDVEALIEANHVPFPVAYAEHRPGCDTVLEETVEWLNKAVLTKGTPWKYEREWRLIRIRGARSVLPLFVPTITGVILGAGIKPSDREEVLRWVRDAHRPIAVVQAQFHETSYELEISTVNDSE